MDNNEKGTVTSEQSTGSKKVIYIIAIIIILLLVWSIMKSGMSPKSPASVMEDASNKIDMSVSDMTRNPDGSYSKTYANGEGTITVGGNKLPDNWPSDAPKYENATIQYSGSSNPQTGETGSGLVFMTTDSIEKVTSFYKKELASKGWVIDQTATIGASTVISAKKDTRTFGVYISDAGEGKVSVTIGISAQK